MDRHVMEVETPIMSMSTATDPQLASVPAMLRTHLPETSKRYYLHTSPEFPMKRLLSAGSGCIYQLCKTFRDGETGERHNPEFTMLEWYRVGFNLQGLMRDVAELVEITCGYKEYSVLTYEEAFTKYLGFNPFTATEGMLKEKAVEVAGFEGELACRDDYLNLLLSVAVEPHLGVDGPVFLTAYPASQASLAKTRTSQHGYKVAERFELYLNGIEIANGYHELTDPIEQTERFLADNIERRKLDLPEIPVDQHLLSAMQNGLPECAGVALGVDRLLMIQQGKSRIQDVLSFPIERA